MIPRDDLLEQLQQDVHAILMAAPALSLAKVILDNQGDLEGRIEHELSTTSERSGKSGLAVIVMPVEVDSAVENMPGPEIEALVTVQVLEQAELNRSGDGTGIRSSTAALGVLQALHHFSLGNRTLYPDKRKPIKALKMRAGFVSHMVAMRVAINCDPVARPPAVSHTQDEEEITLDAGDAAVRWTTDGSFPTMASRDDLTISLETLPAGIVLRACAITTAGPGDLLEITIP